MEGNPGFFKTLPHSIQQVLAMFVSNLVPLGIIAAAAVPAMTTGVVNRNVARVGGVILIFCGLFPPVSRFIGTIPEPVIGGMFLIVMGQIMVSGFEMIAEAGFTARNKLIAAISLSVAIGFTGSSEAGIWSSFPVAIQSIFSQNVVSVIFVLALFLNLVLPKDTAA